MLQSKQIQFFFPEFSNVFELICNFIHEKFSNALEPNSVSDFVTVPREPEERLTKIHEFGTVFSILKSLKLLEM